MNQPSIFSASNLDRLFELVLVNDVVNPAATLPRCMTLDHDPALLADVFGIAKQLWTEDVDQNALLALIRHLGRTGDLDAGERLRFKHMRAKLKLFRFACALRSRRHVYPPLLHHLTTALGHLQDAFKTGQRGRVWRKALIARALLSPPARMLVRHEVEQLQPDTPAGHRAFVAHEVARLRAVLDQPAVTGAEFHAARKIVSRQNAFYTAAATLRPCDEHHAMFLALATINGLMGSLHDDLIERRVAGEQDYHHAPFPLPEQIRHRLLNYVELHARSQIEA